MLDVAPRLLTANLPSLDLVCADSVESALIILKEQGPFAAVITDILLDDGTGDDLLNAIRQGAAFDGTRGTDRDVPVGCYSCSPHIPGDGFTFGVRKRAVGEDMKELATQLRKVLGIQSRSA